MTILSKCSLKNHFFQNGNVVHKRNNLLAVLTLVSLEIPTKYLHDGIIINMCTINNSQCVVCVEFYLR